MQPTTKYWKFPAVFALSLFLLPVVTPATLHTDEPRVQRAGSGAGNGSQASERVGIGCQSYQPSEGFK